MIMAIRRTGHRVVGLLLCAAAASACGAAPDTAPPVARPSVTFSKPRAPLGSPVEIKYRFEVAPNAALKLDYRVMVHFLDADEELMWTDDHTPPVPTSQWKAGQVIEYTRTMFVPIFPYVGEATVTVGLYRPGTNERLPLTGDMLGPREYRAARLQLQPQFDSVLVVFRDGWHPAEAAPDNPALEWQWSRKESTISFRNPRQNAVLYLHYDGQPALFDVPQTVLVQLHGETVDSFPVTNSQDEIRRIPIQAVQFGTEDLVEIRFVVDKTFVPALVTKGSRDPRELGFRVYHAYVDPQ
jgi:hypothetical protein